jgi:hypothetical protein
MRESNIVFEAVTAAAGRQEVAIRAQALAVGRALSMSLSLFDAVPATQTARSDQGQSEWRGGGLGLRDDPVSDRESDRSGDPASGKGFFDSQRELNQRQRWFVRALLAAAPVKAIDLQERWQVSEKTARRDLAHLKRLKLIEFAGAFKNGRYRLCD